MIVSSSVVGAFALVMAVGFFLSKFLRINIDPREPPAVHPKIPLFGHIIGTILVGSSYLQRLSRKHKHPIFTLPMFTGRTYVVASPEIAQVVQRSSTTLVFDPIVIAFVQRFVRLKGKTGGILELDSPHLNGRKPILREWDDLIHIHLAPSKLQEAAVVQLNTIGNEMARIEDGLETDLFHFVTRKVMLATMKTFFGPNNPFVKNPALVESFWDYEDGLIPLVANVFPQVTARKAYRGLEACVDGFVAYTEAGHHVEAHSLVQNRKDLHMSHGFTVREHARMEVGLSFALGSNAAIISFWMLNYIFSSPSLLAEIRTELASATVSPHVFSISRLRALPLFTSVYRETLRIMAPMISSRYVLEDTVIADSYLLRKGGIVQVDGSVLHGSPEVWGPDVADFNPRRFLGSNNGIKTVNSSSSSPSSSSNVHSAAFRSFGGGISLCPGRNFAQNEIMGLAAILVSGFDMLPVKGEASIKWNPETNVKIAMVSVRKPAREVQVRVQRREGLEGLNWAVEA